MVRLCFLIFISAINKFSVSDLEALQTQGGEVYYRTIREFFYD
jgi:hypothetical protein